MKYAESHAWASHPPPLEIASDNRARRCNRELRRQCIRTLLGSPPTDRPDQLRTDSVADHGLYRSERFTFVDDFGAVVTGVLFRPEGSGPFPALLWNHWHGGQYELGIAAMDGTSYTPEAPGPYFAERGYIVCGIDAPGFGARNGQDPDGLGGERGEHSLAKYHLLHGRSLWGHIVHDDLCALNMLAGRSDVIPGRIGTLGISMGCLRSFWISALDERIAACVGICCLTRNTELIQTKGLHLHSLYYYLPSMLRHFDIEGVLECIAPRALLAINGDLDPLTPCAGVRAAERAMRPSWSLEGCDRNLDIDIIPNVGHVWTPDMWTRTEAWLDHHLNANVEC